jgi:hypothetical protein
MEIIENIVWIMTGFISTLVIMVLGWRMGRAKKHKMTSNSKPIVMEQVGA